MKVSFSKLALGTAPECTEPRLAVVRQLQCLFARQSLVSNRASKPTVRYPHKAMGIRSQLGRFRGLRVAIENLGYGLTLVPCKRCDINERLNPVVSHCGDHRARIGMSHQDHGAAAPL